MAAVSQLVLAPRLALLCLLLVAAMAAGSSGAATTKKQSKKYPKPSRDAKLSAPKPNAAKPDAANKYKSQPEKQKHYGKPPTAKSYGKPAYSDKTSQDLLVPQFSCFPKAILPAGDNTPSDTAERSLVNAGRCAVPRSLDLMQAQCGATSGDTCLGLFAYNTGCLASAVKGDYAYCYDEANNIPYPLIMLWTCPVGGSVELTYRAPARHECSALNSTTASTAGPNDGGVVLLKLGLLAKILAQGSLSPESIGMSLLLAAGSGQLPIPLSQAAPGDTVTTTFCCAPGEMFALLSGAGVDATTSSGSTSLLLAPTAINLPAGPPKFTPGPCTTLHAELVDSELHCTKLDASTACSCQVGQKEFCLDSQDCQDPPKKVYVAFDSKVPAEVKGCGGDFTKPCGQQPAAVNPTCKIAAWVQHESGTLVTLQSGGPYGHNSGPCLVPADVGCKITQLIVLGDPTDTVFDSLFSGIYWQQYDCADPLQNRGFIRDFTTQCSSAEECCLLSACPLGVLPTNPGFYNLVQHVSGAIGALLPESSGTLGMTSLDAGRSLSLASAFPGISPASALNSCGKGYDEMCGSKTASYLAAQDSSYAAGRTQGGDYAKKGGYGKHVWEEQEEQEEEVEEECTSAFDYSQELEPRKLCSCHKDELSMCLFGSGGGDADFSYVCASTVQGQRGAPKVFVKKNGRVPAGTKGCPGGTNPFCKLAVWVEYNNNGAPYFTEDLETKIQSFLGDSATYTLARGGVTAYSPCLVPAASKCTIKDVKLDAYGISWMQANCPTKGPQYRRFVLCAGGDCCRVSVVPVADPDNPTSDPISCPAGVSVTEYGMIPPPAGASKRVPA